MVTVLIKSLKISREHQKTLGLFISLRHKICMKGFFLKIYICIVPKDNNSIKINKTRKACVVSETVEMGQLGLYYTES